MKFSIKDFFSKCDQICRKLRIWPHFLKKSLTENFIFCAVGYKLTIVVFVLNSPFSKQKFVVHFSKVICMKTTPCTPLLLYKNELVKHCLSYDMREMARFLGLEVVFSNRLVFQGPFFSQVQGPDPGPIFRRCLYRR